MVLDKIIIENFTASFTEFHWVEHIAGMVSNQLQTQVHTGSFKSHKKGRCSHMISYITGFVPL